MAEEREREEVFRGLRINSPLLARGAVFRTWPFLLSSVHILLCIYTLCVVN
jgi:hypothetical protein